MTATTFDSLDLNHDQRVDFAEFEAWVRGILAASAEPEAAKLTALRFVVT